MAVHHLKVDFLKNRRRKPRIHGPGRPIARPIAMPMFDDRFGVFFAPVRFYIKNECRFGFLFDPENRRGSPGGREAA